MIIVNDSRKHNSWNCNRLDRIIIVGMIVVEIIVAEMIVVGFGYISESEFVHEFMIKRDLSSAMQHMWCDTATINQFITGNIGILSHVSK